jgi:hypothetical protein
MMSEWESVTREIRAVASELYLLADHLDAGGTGLQGRDVRPDLPEQPASEGFAGNVFNLITPEGRAVRDTSGPDPATGPWREYSGAPGSNPGSKGAAPHSEHYKGPSVEPIDLIEAWDLPFHLGCVIKYVCRDKEDRVADLEKARWYLDRYILHLRSK